MSDKSDYLKNNIVNEVMRSSAFTPPAGHFVALSTTLINDDGTGLTEPAGGAYARAAGVWDAPVLGVSQNQLITFAQATGNWGTITHFAIMDAVSAGNMLYHDALTAPLAVNTDDTARFAAGQLPVSEQ